VLALAGPWMLNTMVNYTENLLREIPALVAKG
jgi:flagellar biosynthesis protein FliQ